MLVLEGVLEFVNRLCLIRLSLGFFVFMLLLIQTSCSFDSTPLGYEFYEKQPEDKSLASNLLMYTPKSTADVDVNAHIGFVFNPEALGYTSRAAFMDRVATEVRFWQEGGKRVSYDASITDGRDGNRHLIFRPIEPLQDNAKYVVLIRSGERSSVYEFTTKPRVGPEPSLKGLLYSPATKRLEVHFHQPVTFTSTSDVCLERAMGQLSCLQQSQIEEGAKAQFNIVGEMGQSFELDAVLRINEMVVHEGTSLRLVPDGKIEYTLKDEQIVISLSTLDDCFDGLYCNGRLF